MVKIFAAGDFHSDRLHAQKLAEQAKQEGVDLILLNGDIVEENQIEGVVGPFAGTKIPLALVHGNHESAATMDFLAKRYGGKNLHGYSLKLADGEIGIFGCGGANCGIDMLSEEEIYEILKKSFAQVKDCKKKIMVTHVHPSGTAMEKMSQFVKGSTGLRKAIQAFQPDILICGHVHEAEGLEEQLGKTKIINVGRKGKILEV